ncbi:BTB/POZ domain-containing protein-like [Dorcoceras hygrometricum]|uniref:BTB/POZ domain-containing protein-like n=1 Tax=Dorcoceras hygrometricum TaxID=472368 RepID=A0A2Z7C0G0_9LAMI|nr:BTB/POZ domain-containing protein-like [Dorcoceras hygrometricum]
MSSGGCINNSDGATSDARRKKQRLDTNTCLFSAIESSSRSLQSVVSACGGVFNDAATADVILRLHADRGAPIFVSSGTSSDEKNPEVTVDRAEIHVYLHSPVLCRSKYFAASLSDRWQHKDDCSSEKSRKQYRFSLSVPGTADSIDNYVKVLQLLYSDDLLSSISSVSTVLSILPIALELLFEDCIKACVKFLEAVPWNEDEEEKILDLIPLLSNEESIELLARVSPAKSDSSEEMLHGLVRTAIYNSPSMASGKAFVVKLLKDFSSKELARRVLYKEFEKNLRIVKQAMEEYSSPDFRANRLEPEAIQKVNLYTAMNYGKHLLWLVERMLELKVADSAAKAWSELASFTADLHRAFREGPWRNMLPGLPSVVLRCTSKLSNAVATGSVLATRQVRMNLVRDWLPVLIICKDKDKESVSSPLGPNHKALYLELEESFLRIISTLPMSDSQDLLQQCLRFSTRVGDDCPHLVAAFTTWFRRANRPTV